MNALSALIAELSWIPALTGVWPWVLLAVVPMGIILMYFLKLRREPVEVPSTYLWSRTIEDLHVNSLLQRLRNSMLLLLQLLAVLLATMALFRPGMRGETSSLGRTVFLLDISASMQAPAADASDEIHRTRFEQARKEIGERIESMQDHESAMLITFSDRAEVMQAFTSDRARLREALARCSVTNRPTDILAALRAADGLANPRRVSTNNDSNVEASAEAMPAELQLYSDGNFPTATDFDLGNLLPVYHAMGSAHTQNLAITSFSATRNLQDPTQVEAFATIVNTGDQPVTADASLHLEGRLVDASAVSLDPGAQSGLSFTVEAAEAVRMRLTLDVNDDLSLDNTAYAALTPSGLVSVLVVTDGNRPLELGLTTDKAERIAECEFVTTDYLNTDAYAKRAAAGSDDLMIFDRCKPPKLPAANTFTIADLPSEGWKWTTPKGSLTLIDIDRSHPILRYLEMYSLLVFSGRGMEGPEGTTNLVESDVGNVMAIAPRGGYRDLVLGFPLVDEDSDGVSQANTNWYAERSWPVFLLNLLRYLAGAAASSAATSYQPGETVPVRLESVIHDVDLVRTNETDQGNTVEELVVGEGGKIEIVDTNLPGNYQLVTADARSPDRGAEPASSNTSVVDRFAINLFDSRESRLATKPNVVLGFEKVTAQNAGIESRHEYWRPLLLLVLAVLMGEWLLYSRRVS